RFTALRAGLPGISPNVLTQRLNELEAARVPERRKLPAPVSAWAYELTEWGKALEPIMLQLVYWGARSPLFQRGAPLGVDAMILSFKAMFDADTAQRDNVRTHIQLHVDNDIFNATVDDGRLDVRRGEGQQPMATLYTGPQALLQLAYGKRSIDAAVESGALRYTGERAALVAFFSVFRVPDVAA